MSEPDNSPPYSSSSSQNNSAPKRQTLAGDRDQTGAPLASSSSSGGNLIFPDFGHTPRKSKPHERSRTHNHIKQSAPNNVEAWEGMVLGNHAGNVTLDELFTNYMPPSSTGGDEDEIQLLEERCASQLKKAERAFNKAGVRPEPAELTSDGYKEVKTENVMLKPLIEYFQQLVSGFKDSNKPIIVDTHKTRFESPDEAHWTAPDVMSTRPGQAKRKKWEWGHVGLVAELKWRTDIFKGEAINQEAKHSRDALVQLAKSARSLLMASGACHVYAITVFELSKARIFRFDHTGFRATHAFNWIEDREVFPRFFFRLYNCGRDGFMEGDDDTVRKTTPHEKSTMYPALCANKDFLNDTFHISHQVEDTKVDAEYKENSADNEKMNDPVAEALHSSLCLRAIRGKDESRQLVTCFTVGPPISISNGLFSRATRIYRVILWEDRYEEHPPLYAVKDVWRQACRRPEADFYDTVSRHCEEEKINMDQAGMARCHGSIDLSDTTLREHLDSSGQQLWNPAIHGTRSASQADLERCHTRILLTPVGRPLHKFKSTKALVHALYSAVLQHEIAYEAGVLHRDISDGNLLFNEVTVDANIPRAFLVDWDYADFTEKGAENFNKWFPARTKAVIADVPKHMKDVTGTFPFMAIEILPDSRQNSVEHGPHHDLESIYWLLVWMVLRHVKHDHPDGPFACIKLFEDEGPQNKNEWLARITNPIKDPTSPLHLLLRSLILLVCRQNKTEYTKFLTGENSVSITHDDIKKAFELYKDLPNWPVEDDEAKPYVVPKKTPGEQDPEHPHTLRMQAATNSLRRSHRKAESQSVNKGTSGETAASRASGSAIKRSASSREDSGELSDGATLVSRDSDPRSKKMKTDMASKPSASRKQGSATGSRSDKGSMGKKAPAKRLNSN